MADVQHSTSTGPQDQSTVALLRQLTEQVSTLVRDEVTLARQELRQKGRRVGAGAGALGAGGVLALYGGGALVAAAILGIAQVLRPWLAALVLGAALLVVAGVAALAGRGQVRRATPPVPRRAAASVREDLDTVRHRMHDG
ncbi:MAG TPA: phage holin family protein [Mycobacteriales bacterium]|nr:phage holin family protein [Mycobacteriales bacterium]